jgi:uncharacterized membrane protein YccF (DUF307 family)
VSTLGNFVWFLMAWPLSLAWAFAALLFCWTPYARSFLEMSKLCLAPFGKAVISLQEEQQAKRFLKGQADCEPQEEQPWSTTLGRYFNIPAGDIENYAKKAALVFNILWIPCGVMLAGLHLCHALFLAMTIVGLPMVPATLRIASLAIWPIGKRVVDKRYADMVREALYKQRLAT